MLLMNNNTVVIIPFQAIKKTIEIRSIMVTVNMNSDEDVISNDGFIGGFIGMVCVDYNTGLSRLVEDRNDSDKFIIKLRLCIGNVTINTDFLGQDNEEC